MPCYRCGARQIDPVRGPSPWKRGVRAGEQVLVCPDCQQVHDWAGDMDRCASCGSVSLVRVLGETRCQACGSAFGELGRADAASARGTSPGPLSDDVAAAVARVLGRYPGPAEGS